MLQDDENIGPSCRRRSVATGLGSGRVLRVTGGLQSSLADRMGCLKGGVVANVVVPTPDYVRFAVPTGSCQTSARPPIRSPGRDVENLIGYSKEDQCPPGNRS